MEDSVENEYIVTDENGCATDPSIFGEWQYNSETNSLLATFNAFKFPSSDNIRFQCNIRVCFGRCQPVNCRGYDAFGKRRRRALTDATTTTNATTRTSRSSSNDDGLGAVQGQMREEIVISSNAILTLERRDERLSDGSDSKFFLYTIYCILKIFMKSPIFANLTKNSSSKCTTSRRYLRLNDWTNHCIGHYGPVVTRCGCRGRFMLANGVPSPTQGHRSITTSARIS